jgi:hypothetical protein
MLYNQNTWQPTDRLLALREGQESLTREDVVELFEVFMMGCEEYAQKPTMYDFGTWISATHPFEKLANKAEVFW